MSFKRTSHNLEDLISKFDRLILSLERALKKIRPRSNVKNTRIGKIRRDLDRVLELEAVEQKKLFEIVIKLNQINVVFDSAIEFKSDDIIRLIEGEYDLLNDDQIKSHDYVFEFVTGVRFALATEGAQKVSLSGRGDVKVGEDIAIECKNIRSLNNLVKNVDKGKLQIEKRVASGEVGFGFIALDVSNIFPESKAQEFINKTFDEFYKNHARLKEFQCFDQEVIDSVLEDKNFQKIIQSYIMHEAETALYSALPLRYDMGGATLAIIFQVNKCFLIEDRGQHIPLPIRGMTYLVNGKLSGDSRSNVENYIKRLAVGF